MAEPIDVIVPILRGIQQDIADIKVELRGAVAKLGTVEHDLRTLKHRTIALMGFDADRSEAIKEQAEEIAAIKRRLDALEQAR
jgi:hypothetical protein